jgi:isopropylmalate/homocitrate/citramalate synthase
MKNPEVYLPYDTDLILGIPYTISITPYSGRSAIAYWINTYFRLSRDEALSKDDPRVSTVYEEVQRIFSEGRKDALNDDEMLAIVRKYIPELVEGRFRSVGVHG